MIHSQDPARKTDGRLIASAYFYKDLKIMAKFARLLGKSADAARYDTDAQQLKEAFNNVFLTTQPASPDKAVVAFYGNNTVTANLLPLAFGGKHTGSKGITILKCRSVRVEADTPLPLHTDGEPGFPRRTAEAGILDSGIWVITG